MDPVDNARVTELFAEAVLAADDRFVADFPDERFADDFAADFFAADDFAADFFAADDFAADDFAADFFAPTFFSTARPTTRAFTFDFAGFFTGG